VPSGRRGLGSGNQKNSGVRCLLAGTIRHEARSSRLDAHPRRILGDDIGLCVRRWAGWRTRWIRRSWLKRTRWTLVAGISFKALLRSTDWTLDWALFCSSLWPSPPRSQRSLSNCHTTGARKSFGVAGIRPAGVGPPAEGSIRFEAPPSVFSSGAEPSALANASTDGSSIISGSATVGTVLATVSFLIPFSLAGFPVRLPMARRLMATGLEVGRNPTQRSGLQPSAWRISAGFQTKPMRHRTRATAPHHRNMV